MMICVRSVKKVRSNGATECHPIMEKDIFLLGVI